MTAAPERCIVCGTAASDAASGGGVLLLRCPACGLAWRREFPDSSELAALYGESYFDRWGIDGPERLAEVRSMKAASYHEFLREVGIFRPGGTLLDVGCALGFLLGVAREHGYDVRGLDLNADAVAAAAAEFGAQVHAGPLDEHAFPGERFDVVTLIDVLEHVPDPSALLGSIATRLLPGGVAAAVLPNTASAVCRLLGRRWPHYNAEHLFYWSATCLPRYFEKLGWRVLALQPGVRKTFTARYLDHYARTLGRRLLPGLGRLGGLRLRVPTGEMLVIATPLDAVP